MAFNTYLQFDRIALPKPTRYDISLHDVVSASSGETEAGTIQRDVVRTGVTTIAVSFAVSAEWLSLLSSYAQESRISVAYLDPQKAELRETEMYIADYAVKLAHDTSYGSLWTVSFNLMEY